jgi:hypothetical protein
MLIHVHFVVSEFITAEASAANTCNYVTFEAESEAD